MSEASPEADESPDNDVPVPDWDVAAEDMGPELSPVPDTAPVETTSESPTVDDASLDTATAEQEDPA